MRRARAEHRRRGARVWRLGLRRVPRVRARRGAALRAESRRRASRRDGGYAEQCSCPTPGTSCRCGTWTRSRRRRWPMPASRPTAPSGAPALAAAGHAGAADRLRRARASSRSSTCAGCPTSTIAVRELDPDSWRWRAGPRRRPGPAAGDESLVDAGPGRPRRRRARLRRDRRDARTTRPQRRRARRPGDARRRGGRPPRRSASTDRRSSPWPRPRRGARSTTCARSCGWRDAAGCAGTWSACRSRDARTRPRRLRAGDVEGPARPRALAARSAAEEAAQDALRLLRRPHVERRRATSYASRSAGARRSVTASIRREPRCSVADRVEPVADGVEVAEQRVGLQLDAGRPCRPGAQQPGALDLRQLLQRRVQLARRTARGTCSGASSGGSSPSGRRARRASGRFGIDAGRQEGQDRRPRPRPASARRGRPRPAPGPPRRARTGPAPASGSLSLPGRTELDERCRAR